MPNYKKISDVNIITDSQSLIELTEYKIASENFCSENPILLGPSSALTYYKQDILKRGEDSKYYSSVLYPEYRNETWDRNKNNAFIAGGILTGRHFKLLIGIKNYLNPKKNKAGLITGTQLELYILEKCGYRFTYNREDLTTCIATPPQEKPAIDLVLSHLIPTLDAVRESMARIKTQCDAYVLNDAIKVGTKRKLERENRAIRSKMAATDSNVALLKALNKFGTFKFCSPLSSTTSNNILRTIDNSQI